jgi:hypothetical protein
VTRFNSMNHDCSIRQIAQFAFDTRPKLGKTTAAPYARLMVEPFLRESRKIERFFKTAFYVVGLNWISLFDEFRYCERIARTFAPS